MKEGLLAYLACPSCEAELDLAVTRREGSEIIEGALRCRGCGRSFAITRAIPRLLSDRLVGDQRKTADAFGWQW